MRKRVRRARILWGIVALFLIAASVVTIVYFTRDKSENTVAELPVVRASLSSRLSSTGVVKNISTRTKIPLAVMAIDDLTKLSEIVNNDYTVNLITLLREDNPDPILYRVAWVNESLVGKKTTFRTTEENRDLITLVPIYFDWDVAAEHYAIEASLGTPEAEGVREYVLSLLLRDGVSQIDPTVFPNEFWRADEDAAITVGSERLGDMILAELSHVEDIRFSITDFVWNEGDVLMLDNSLFTIDYSELFVSFVLSEYDVSVIHARMEAGERVYASVGINALGGREVIAEIVRIQTGTNSSGVSYFTLLGRLVFPEVTVKPDGTEEGDYSYYDEFLSADTVTYLGVDVKDNLTPEELLDNYSVTVTAQKTVVNDTLIVPTKCIYYDDSKDPYVVKLDAEKKEKRIYIKITLSTGTEAAIEPMDGYALEEGDMLRYTVDSTLIDSLF